MRCELALVTLLAACGSRRELVDASAWQALPAGEDPFDDAPVAAFCPPVAIVVEVDDAGSPTLEVDTDPCPYVALVQPSLSAARRGEEVRLRLRHAALSSEVPAEAHIAVRLADQTLLDERLSIPRAEGSITRAVLLDAAVPVGDPVILHLHNHGDNTYNLDRITVGPEGAEETP